MYSFIGKEGELGVYKQNVYTFSRFLPPSFLSFPTPKVNEINETRNKMAKNTDMQTHGIHKEKGGLGIAQSAELLLLITYVIGRVNI